MRKLTDAEKLKLFDELYELAYNFDSAISCLPCSDEFIDEMEAWEEFVQRNKLDD